MSLASQSTERAKYRRLLELAQAQLRAIEADEREEFDRIIDEKSAIVESLVEARRMVSDDPVVAKIVEQIQLCDKTAQRLMYTQVGKVIKELADLHLYQNAKSAYAKSRQPKSVFAMSHQTDAPRFFDQKT